MRKNISIFGLGYVGSVTAACLAQRGHKVVGVDLNPDKINVLESGRSSIVEVGMEDLVASGRRACRLHATTDAISAVLQSEISLICVGTPGLRNGKLDLGHIERVSREIGEALRQKSSFHCVVLRSTVLPGTTESVVIPIFERSSRQCFVTDITLCFNPSLLPIRSA